MNTLHVCPGTLAEGYQTFSPAALRHLFGGKKVAHTLPFVLDEVHQQQHNGITNPIRISISGVQEKYALRLEKNQLVWADQNSTYILKPIHKGLDNADQVPANEHLTMQIARQLFKLDVAKCAIIFFNDGEPAYITKRFDVMPDNSRCLKEDFASLLQKTSEGGNSNFKYNGSYFDMAMAIDNLLPAPVIAKERLFNLIVFNYLFSNGDAHLKNYSVVDYEQNGLYQMAPAYDLLNTRLHIEDGDMALEEGLYAGDYTHPSFEKSGYYAYDDFYDFGIKIHLKEQRIQAFLANFLDKSDQVLSLIKRSFLSEVMQQKYAALYQDRLRRLRFSVSGLIK